MSTFSKLESILKRLDNCPLNLVRVELETFQNTLTADTCLSTIMTDIITSNKEVLGSKAATLVNIASSPWADLSFANSDQLRAAVGYQVCQSLLGEHNPIKCAKNVITMGSFYAAYRGGISGLLPQAEAIRVFSEVFLQPLVLYLRGAMKVQDELLKLISRYRQRSEWFTNKKEIDAMLKEGGEIEKRLKKDFLRYIFDNGIDFSVESEAPSGHGEVDILAVVPEIGSLPIEVKVYDGAKRNIEYISGGLAQTLEYARKFNSHDAYYIVYNVAENELLLLPGTAVAPYITNIQLQGVTIYSIVINLRITLPASQIKKITPKTVPLPS